MILASLLNSGRFQQLCGERNLNFHKAACTAAQISAGAAATVKARRAEEKKIRSDNRGEGKMHVYIGFSKCHVCVCVYVDVCVCVVAAGQASSFPPHQQKKLKRYLVLGRSFGEQMLSLHRPQQWRTDSFFPVFFSSVILLRLSSSAVCWFYFTMNTAVD